jgi:uncharacterized protein (DUF302 family)
MLKKSIIAIASLFVVASCAQAAMTPDHKDDYRVTYKVKAKFEDVRDQLKSSITGKGIKINNVSFIGKMLIRTGKDLGFKKEVFTQAQAFEFCTATHSRFMMEADPHNIVFCPYIISVYELANEKGKVYLSYRRPSVFGSESAKQSLQNVEKLMDEIAQETLSWF